MTNVSCFLLRLLCVLCLALYGSFGMAASGADGAVFPVEICADGVSRTVLVGADGQPVEAGHSCPDCTMCCAAMGIPPDTLRGMALTFALSKDDVGRTAFRGLVFNRNNILPAPRGPPALPGFPVLVEPDQAMSGSDKRSDGRPLLKDADA